MKVLVSVPNTGWIHKHVTFAAVRILRDGRHSANLILPTHNPYENNLHHILNDFMAGDFEFWLNIDADNPPMKNPLDLVDHDLDIVGLPTPVWHSGKKGDRPVYWNGYDCEGDAYKEHEPRKGLQKVDAVGTGCFLVARRVFENPEMRKAPFQRQYYEDGRVHKGNDISFCERARAQGIDIWCHYDYPCMHFNELELNETVGAFRSLYE